MKKIHRFISNFDLNQDVVCIEDKSLINQFLKVLKFKIGEKIALCDGNNHEAICEIQSLDAKQVTLKVLSKEVLDIESDIKVILFCAVLKRENFELVVQKATEVGVREIVPILTKRTIKQNIKLDRLQTIAKEASEQCGRALIPVVHPPMVMDKAIKDALSLKQNYFFDLHVKKLFLENSNSFKQSVGIWIGPEGGWDDSEVKAIKNAKFYEVKLGKTVLRAETAAIIATYIACNNI